MPLITIRVQRAEKIIQHHVDIAGTETHIPIQCNGKACTAHVVERSKGMQVVPEGSG